MTTIVVTSTRRKQAKKHKELKQKRIHFFLNQIQHIFCFQYDMNRKQKCRHYVMITKGANIAHNAL